MHVNKPQLHGFIQAYGRMFTRESATEACQKLGSGLPLPTDEEWGNRLGVALQGPVRPRMSRTGGDSKTTFSGTEPQFWDRCRCAQIPLVIRIGGELIEALNAIFRNPNDRRTGCAEPLLMLSGTVFAIFPHWPNSHSKSRFETLPNLEPHAFNVLPSVE